jgi:hypothetical protein
MDLWPPFSGFLDHKLLEWSETKERKFEASQRSIVRIISLSVMPKYIAVVCDLNSSANRCGWTNESHEEPLHDLIPAGRNNP